MQRADVYSDDEDEIVVEELREDEAGVPAPLPNARLPFSPAPGGQPQALAQKGAGGAGTGTGPDGPGLPTTETAPDDVCMGCAVRSAQPRTCPACRAVVFCSDACFARCAQAHAPVCALLRKVEARAPLAEAERQRLGLGQAQIAAPEFADAAPAPIDAEAVDERSRGGGGRGGGRSYRGGGGGGGVRLGLGGWGWGGAPWRGRARGWYGQGAYYGNVGFPWGARPCWWYYDRGLPCPYGLGGVRVGLGPFSAGIVL